jgi:hypothetical protein
MVQPIYELSEWLEAQKGRTLIIQKGELSIGKQDIIDVDQVQLHLDAISIRNIERHDPDDYLADQELILHGSGKIGSDQGEVDLPQNIYEIPIHGEITTTRENNGVKVKTERAIYTIFSQ